MSKNDPLCIRFGDISKKGATYTLSMQYDQLYNPSHKTLNVSQTGMQYAGKLSTGSDLSFVMATNHQQIANIADTSYRRTAGEAPQPIIKKQDYAYDANGNLLTINSYSPSGAGGSSKRGLLWDEENHLLGVNDNGYVSTYWYDASGERTVKQSGDALSVAVNGTLSGASTGTTNFTAYINPYTVINNGNQMSKHIYVGTQRIMSKLCDAGAMADPTAATKATYTGSTLKYADKYKALTATVKARYDSLGVVYNGVDNNGATFYKASSSTPSGAGGSYYYHSDHLGSANYITDETGSVAQHLEYIPYGETFVDERYSTWHSPYKFNGKERDEETGLTYYGARYLDGNGWLSVDPLAQMYPSTGSYVYCLGNPIKYIDPDGRSTNVTKNGDGTYTVVGGNLNDKDKGIYVGAQDDKGNFTRTSDNPIGKRTSMTTFYNDDKKEDGSDKGWMGQINPGDNSGKKFLANIMYDTPSLTDYIPNARNGDKYDFKSTNGTDKKIYSTDQEYYRGMPMGTSEDGLTVYSSARDIGNMGAGYVSGANGLTWGLARLGFDLYNFKQNGVYPEGSSTQNPELNGWKLGHSRLVNEIKKYGEGKKKNK
jgi:RHS repeat-associated protein